MVKAEFSLSEDKKNLILKVKGHAGQAEQGRDLVCAVVSGFAHGLANNVNKLYQANKLRKKPTVRLGAGDAEIVVKPKKDTWGICSAYYIYCQSEFEVVADSYPEYVSLKKLDAETLKEAMHK